MLNEHCYIWQYCYLYFTEVYTRFILRRWISNSIPNFPYLQRQMHSFFHIMWDNHKAESTVSLFFETFPKAHKESVHAQWRDYGSVTWDFSLLLLITCIVWLASRGKRSTLGYYAHMMRWKAGNSRERAATSGWNHIEPAGLFLNVGDWIIWAVLCCALTASANQSKVIRIW